jgi:hypothetical protein
MINQQYSSQKNKLFFTLATELSPTQPHRQILIMPGLLSAPYVPSGRLPIGMDLSAAIWRHGVIRRKERRYSL